MTIQEGVSLTTHTTFKIGGPARYFSVAKSVEDIKDLLAYAREKELKVFVLGWGSNILVSDKGFDGLVIKMDMKGVTFEKDGRYALVTAWAGEGWDELVAKTVEWGVWGLENLSLIPGTVGASPVQNIGAYGREVMDIIDSVRVVDASTGEEKVMNNKECGFSYRDSIFKKPESKNLVILSVTLKLPLERSANISYKDLALFFKDKPEPSQSEIRDAVIAIRMSKFPDLRTTGTAGSFWKNPIISNEHYGGLLKQYPTMPHFRVSEEAVKVPLAWILDNVCGLKGFEMGKAGLYKKQPLVLVATLGATFDDVEALEKHVKKVVFDKTGIEIEREVEHVGE
jgi:UDP-N-acetylmuramate dehydrogenase